MTTYNCEFISPAFIYGANKEPEFRIPSLKGIIRYWWRAAKVLPTQELREEESKLFGSSSNKYGKSQLIMQVIKDQTAPKNTALLPHKNKVQRKALIGSVKIALLSKDYIRIFENTFELAITLGGIGRRTRRGFGSMNIIKKNNDNYEYHDINDLFDRLFKLLLTFNNNFTKIDEKTIVYNDNSDNDTKANYPYIKAVYIGESYEKVNDALIKIGKIAHNFSDYDSLGYAKGEHRLASPVVVSISKVKNEFYLIITKLNTPDNINDLDCQDEFIKKLGGSK